MDSSFGKGVAFIVEGDTEKVFYLSLLDFLCRKHGCTLERHIVKDDPDIEYLITCGTERVLVKFTGFAEATTSQRANWFKSRCVNKYGKGHAWHVFLCYDTDNYLKDISRFYKGDWEVLRNKLRKAESVTDVAASADIEDVMLQDLAGVCRYLKSSIPADLPGRKGKVKMKKLFRDNGVTYHEGERARELIETLDMQAIIDSGIVPLSCIEQTIFC